MISRKYIILAFHIHYQSKHFSQINVITNRFVFRQFYLQIDEREKYYIDQRPSAISRTTIFFFVMIQF